MKFSVVIPIFNEQDSICDLIQTLHRTFVSMQDSWEIICVDDGSTDESATNIMNIMNIFRNILLIRLDRNYGQTQAIMAGFDNARGELIVTIDADLQNSPFDIIGMLEIIDSGNYQIVSGWRKTRMDSQFRLLQSKMGNLLVRYILNTNLRDSGCSLKIYRKNAIENLYLVGDMHRFIPSVSMISNGLIYEMPVSHSKRSIGKSKYGNGWKRTSHVIRDIYIIRSIKKEIIAIYLNILISLLVIASLFMLKYNSSKIISTMGYAIALIVIIDKISMLFARTRYESQKRRGRKYNIASKSGND